MNIMYKKDTLYVLLDEQLNKEVIDRMECKVDNIMKRYNIENLVINTKDKSVSLFYEFEKRHNSKYRSKVIIK